jgi:O-antigen ligase
MFSKLDIWHAQGLWTQLMIMICFSWSFFEKPRNVQKRNIPLGLIHLWVGLLTGFMSYRTQIVGKYDVAHLLPYFNFLCLLIFYKLVTAYLNRAQIEKILIYLRYVILATLMVCVLQVLGLGQFFKLLSTHHAYNNIVTGFLGNGTHLSGFLASCIPLFLWKAKREDWLAIILMALVLWFTSTTKNDPAVSGYIVALVIFMYFYRSIWWLLLIPIGIVGLKFKPEMFSFSGRIGIWKEYLELFKQVPVTGAGLGTINQIYQKTAMPEARHLHMEFFHFTFELGIIGCVLMINMVKGFFEIKATDRTEIVLKAMVLGFLVSSCFNYPAHLWLPSSVAVFAYSSYFTLKEEK